MSPVLWFCTLIVAMVLVIVIWPVGLLVSTKVRTVTKVEEIVIPQTTVHTEFGKDLRSVNIEDL